MSKARIEKETAFISRLFMAMFGGIALIVPTVIMVKKPGTDVSLIVTSVSVVLFAAILALGAVDSTGKDVLSATAAYTAVLVVFIGTSIQGTSGSTSASGSSNSTLF